MIQTAIWQDEDFVALSAEAKTIYLMLMTQPTVTTCGVQALKFKYWAKITNLSPRKIVLALAELALAGFTLDDPENEEIVIRSWVKHNVGDVPKMRVAARDQFQGISSDRIKTLLIEEYPDVFEPSLDKRRRQKRPKMTPAKRFKVLERDKFRCRYCGRGPDSGAELVIDHLQPVSKGGSNNLENLVTACADCNGSKHDQEPEGPPPPISKIPYPENEDTVSLETPDARGTWNEVRGEHDPLSSPIDLKREDENDDWAMRKLLQAMGEPSTGQVQMELQSWRGRGSSDHDFDEVRRYLEKKRLSGGRARGYVMTSLANRLTKRKGAA